MFTLSKISDLGSSIAKAGGKAATSVGGYLPDNETLLPILYFTGAAGSLAYGTYALIDHVRDVRKTNSAGNIAKVGAPMLVGSGLVFLGVHGLWSGKPMEVEAGAGKRRGRAGSKKSRGRARTARASAG